MLMENFRMAEIIQIIWRDRKITHVLIREMHHFHEQKENFTNFFAKTKLFVATFRKVRVTKLLTIILFQSYEY